MTVGRYTWLWCVIGMLWCGSSAHALEEYAADIRDQLELADQPSCGVCHTRNANGLAADTAFGDALKDRGFSRRLGLSSLRSALSAIDQLNVDSDLDGVGDVDELRAGADPNDVTDAGMPPADCSVGRGSSPIADASVVLVCLALFIRRRLTKYVQ